ncbi:MAG TPA: amidohydrolase family protein [Azospirillaceae bacterium]|nr:amidohydrolase family protein [Azospirillaceae bacterium]
MNSLAGIPVIDAHHHLWQLSAVPYPWLQAKGVRRFFGDPTPIQRDYRAEDLRADAGALDLRGSVHIQVGAAPGAELAETEWLEREADRTGLPSAIVAFCDLSHADAPRMLERQRAHGRVRGIRQIVGRSPEEDAATGSGALLDDPVWRANLARLPALGLSFDLQAIPSQLERCAEVLAGIPDLDVALCHAGSPWGFPWHGQPEEFKRWRRGIQALARLPRVRAKLSGLAMFRHGWSLADIRPIADTLLEAFGPERLMLGSNFPVDGLHKPYRHVWDGYAAVLTGLSRDELARVAGGTAVDFYRL